MTRSGAILAASATPDDVSATPVASRRAASTQTAKPTLVSLQYLRAAAALLVVYYHAVIQVNDVGFAPKYYFPLFGRSGVDIFFVLSGLVMWISTIGRDTHPADFLKRRIARIVPLYWAATLAAAAVALAAPNLLRSTRLDLPHLVASIFFIPWPNPLAVEKGLSEYITPIVVPGWTLNFEMLFYVIFAIALLVAPRKRFLVVAALMTAIFMLGSGLAPLGAAPRFYASDIMFEFAAGVGLGAFVTKRLRLPPMASTSIIVIAFALLILGDYFRPPILRALLLGIPAMLIVACTLQLERSGRIGFFRLWDDLGDASYSIYLTHIFVIAGLRVLFKMIGPGPSPLAGALFILLALVLSAAIGLVVFAFFERSAVRLAKRLLRV